MYKIIYDHIVIRVLFVNNKQPSSMLGQSRPCHGSIVHMSNVVVAEESLYLLVKGNRQAKIWIIYIKMKMHNPHDHKRSLPQSPWYQYCHTGNRKENAGSQCNQKLTTSRHASQHRAQFFLYRLTIRKLRRIQLPINVSRRSKAH